MTEADRLDSPGDWTSPLALGCSSVISGDVVWRCCRWTPELVRKAAAFSSEVGPEGQG